MKDQATPISDLEARERRMLEGMARGDLDALRDFYRMYRPRLFKFIYRLTGCYGTSEEVVNDVLLAVWRQADTFRGAAKVSTWVFGIAYRQAMKQLSRRQLRISADIEPDELSACGERFENEELVSKALQQLPVAQRLSMVLVFYLGLSYTEVAEVTGTPVNTVKTRMFHARLRLKDLLSAAGSPAQLSGKRS